MRHAYNLAVAFRDEGLKAQAVSGETPKRELASILARYERGDIDVLINAQLLAEGWNSPRATVCVHLAPTASKRIYQQRVGRVTRRHPGKEAGLVVDFVHPATKHDDPVVTLHSLLDRDVYRGGAIVVGPVRRGRGRRVRVERRVLPVCPEPERRAEVFERELWRIAVEHLDYGEQHVWAALAGARVQANGWRRARAMLHFDRDGELRRRFLRDRRAAQPQPGAAAQGARRDRRGRDPDAFDTAIDIIGTWTREERREGAKIMLQAMVDKRIGRRDQANAWIWRIAEYTREVHEEYAVQRWPETKRLLGLLVNSSGAAHARNARRLVQAARKQDRRLAAALLAAALAHTPEAEEVLRGARTRMARKPPALARELLRNFPKRRGRGKRRRRRGGEAGEPIGAEALGSRRGERRGRGRGDRGRGRRRPRHGRVRRQRRDGADGRGARARTARRRRPARRGRGRAPSPRMRAPRRARATAMATPTSPPTATRSPPRRRDSVRPRDGVPSASPRARREAAAVAERSAAATALASTPGRAARAARVRRPTARHSRPDESARRERRRPPPAQRSLRAGPRRTSASARRRRPRDDVATTAGGSSRGRRAVARRACAPIACRAGAPPTPNGADLPRTRASRGVDAARRAARATAPRRRTSTDGHDAAVDGRRRGAVRQVRDAAWRAGADARALRRASDARADCGAVLSPARRGRCTSPASSAMTPRAPAGATSSRPCSSMPAPSRCPRARRRCAPSSASRSRQASSISRGGRGEPALEQLEQARERRLDRVARRGRACRRSRAARPAARRARTATLTPIPSTAQPSCGRPSIRIPPTLRPSSEDVVGPLQRARAGPASSATATPAAIGSSGGGSRSTSEHSSALPGRRVPAAALAAAAVASARRRVTSVPCGAPAIASSRASTLVEPVTRRCTRGRAERRSPCGARHRARSALRRRGASAEQLGGRAAVDRERERAARVAVGDQLAGRDVAEGAPERAPACAAPADLDRERRRRARCRPPPRARASRRARRCRRRRW